MSSIYLDMDGVLADFEGAMASRGIKRNESFLKPKDQWNEEDRRREVLIENEMKQEGFWKSIPKTKDADVLWTFCQSFKPVVLTAKPRFGAYSKTVSEEKFNWINDNLGPLPKERFICCLRSEKKDFIHHAPHQNQILVDDHPENCRDWEDAGGIGILHTSASKSIEALKRIIYV